MFLSSGNRQLLKQLGVPIWRLREQRKSNSVPSSNNNLAYFYCCNTNDFFICDQPSQPIDCLILGEFVSITKNEPINTSRDKRGALLHNMLKAADLLAYDLYFMDVEVIQTIRNESSSTPKTDKYTNSLFDQLRLISPKVIYAMGRVASELIIKPGTSVNKERLKLHLSEHLNTPILVSFELSHLLKKRQDKQKAWEDLMYLTEILRKYS